MEGLIFGGGEGGLSTEENLRLEGNLPILLCFTLHLRAISKYKPPPPGGEGLIFGAAI